MRKVLKEHPRFPTKRIHQCRARLHIGSSGTLLGCIGGSIPHHWPIVINLTEEHQHRL